MERQKPNIVERVFFLYRELGREEFYALLFFCITSLLFAVVLLFGLRSLVLETTYPFSPSGEAQVISVEQTDNTTMKALRWLLNVSGGSAKPVEYPPTKSIKVIYQYQISDEVYEGSTSWFLLPEGNQIPDKAKPFTEVGAVVPLYINSIFTSHSTLAPGVRLQSLIMIVISGCYFVIFWILLAGQSEAFEQRERIDEENGSGAAEEKFTTLLGREGLKKLLKVLTFLTWGPILFLILLGWFL